MRHFKIFVATIVTIPILAQEVSAQTWLYDTLGEYPIDRPIDPVTRLQMLGIIIDNVVKTSTSSSRKGQWTIIRQVRFADFDGRYWDGQHLNFDCTEAFKSLTLVRISNVEDPDAVISCLRPARHLRALYINARPLTDAGLSQVTHFPELFYVAVTSDQITVKGIEALAAMPNLERMTLSRCPKVIPKDWNRFRANPRLRIDWYDGVRPIWPEEPMLDDRLFGPIKN